jgi:(p)ppGpp synthase/HD superfamily hydrolase
MMNLLEKAIELAVRAHSGQMDEDGLPHIVHCLEVMLATKRLAEADGGLSFGGNNDADAEEAFQLLLIKLMTAAVLHDTVEDTFVTLDFIEQTFGKDVRDLVDGVSRRSTEGDYGRGTKESYRDFIYRAKQTPGSRLIKIADLNHNYGRSSKIKKASWREKLQLKYSTAIRVLNDNDQPTWEQASSSVDWDISKPGPNIPHYFVADPNGKKIEVTEAEFKSLTKLS